LKDIGSLIFVFLVLIRIDKLMTLSKESDSVKRLL